MRVVDMIPSIRRHAPAFTLVELLVVIAIMSILMTAGAIGLGGIGGKGVTSGVASAEALFDEARSL
ncbi:MAG: prepilin-type N-terminal cleavage/methylation domain-containing protein, partial [Luteolibacter sp.]